MATNRLHLSARSALAAVAAAVALAVPDVAAAYGWPVKPFDRQHPVRGFFGDPRIHGDSRDFHFGIDVSAPDGTPVYATVSGRVYVDGETVGILSGPGKDASHEYWHVVPTVRSGSWATAGRTIVGRIAAGWGHVHFAEVLGGRYVNPLRPGALAPFADRTRPTARSITFEHDGAPVGRELHGRLDLVAEALDTTPVAVPAPWRNRPVTPVLVRWRLDGAARWRTAADFRLAQPRLPFESVYARWTRQNRPWSNGRYRFVLARAFDTRALRDGLHRLEVAVADTRGNRSRYSVRFTVANATVLPGAMDAGGARPRR